MSAHKPDWYRPRVNGPIRAAWRVCNVCGYTDQETIPEHEEADRG